MGLTEEQLNQVVEHNIKISEDLIFRAGLINKGIHVHDINNDVALIGSYINLHKRNKFLYDDDNFKALCKRNMHLASLLYYHEHKIG